VVTDVPLADHDFGLTFPGALGLERRTEYCQWTETHTDTEHTDSDGNKYTTRQYYYSKGWESHLIPSIFFDQPAAHHNPQRDPFPATGKLFASGATVGQYHIGKNLISKNRIPERRVQFSPAELGKIRNTAANSQHNFKYIGSGYFFSAYEPSGVEKALKLMVGYMEGSLLDWQIGDLFSNCEAGDIRVSFIDQKPEIGKGLSVIGKQVTANGELELLKASNGYHVGVVHEGSYSSPKEMLDQEISFHNWTLMFARLFIVFWAIVVSLVLLGDYVKTGSDLFLSTTMLTSSMLGLIWLSLLIAHGVESSNGIVMPLIFLIIGAGSAFVLTSSGPSQPQQIPPPRVKSL